MKIKTQPIVNYFNSFNSKRKTNSINCLDASKSTISHVYYNAIINDLAICFMIINTKFYVLNNLDLNSIKYFLKQNEELVDGTDEKFEKKKSSEQKSTDKNQSTEQKSGEEQLNPSGGGSGNGDDGREDKNDKDQSDPDYSESEEEQEQEDETNEKDQEEGEYSESDSEEKQAKDIEKAKKVYHGPKKEGELEGEESIEPEEVVELFNYDSEPENPEQKTPKRRRKREMSPMFKKRTPQEQEVIHQYYERMQDVKKAGGVRHSGDLIHSFSKKKQDIIHSYLHDIGTKGAEIKYGKKYSTSSEEKEIEETIEKEGEPTQEKVEVETEGVSFLDRYPTNEQKVILKFFQDVSKKRVRGQLESGKAEEQEKTEKESGESKRKKVKAEKISLQKKSTKEPKKSLTKKAKSEVELSKESPSEKQKALKKQSIDVELKISEVKEPAKDKENTIPKSSKNVKDQPMTKKRLSEITNVKK